MWNAPKKEAQKAKTKPVAISHTECCRKQMQQVIFSTKPWPSPFLYLFGSFNLQTADTNLFNINSQKSFLVFSSIQKCWVTILAVIGIKDLSVMLYTYIFSPNNPYCTSPLFGKYVILCCMKNAIYFTKLNLICLLLHIQSDTFKLSSHLKFQISQPFFSHI